MAEKKLTIPTLETTTADQTTNDQVDDSGVISDEVPQDSVDFVLDAFAATDDEAGGNEDMPSEGDEAPAEGKAAPAAQPAEGVLPTAEQLAAAKPGEPAQPVQQVAPVQPLPGQAQATQQPGQPASSQAAPQENAFQVLHSELEKQREGYIKATAKSLEDTFTDEDIEELQTNPKAGFAKMGARLHHDIVSNMMNVVAAKIPGVVNGLMQAHTAQTSARDQFFAEYPHLKAHEDKLMPIATMVRQLNPTAPDAEFKKLLAVAAGMALGVQPQPAAPTRQVRKAPGFTPAGGRSGAAPAAKSASNNQWAQIDEIIEAENDGRLNGL